MQEFCVGCGICLGLCPTKNIKLENSNVRLIPSFNDSCIKCGVCIYSCPALSNFYNERPARIGSLLKIFFCYSTNNEIRYHGASGGVVTTLLLYMLEHKIVDKVLVVRVKRIIAHPLITSNQSEVITAQGSIYFKTFSLKCLRKLNNYINNGERICIVGLPCQISMLKRILKNHKSQLLFIGLICNHVNEIWPLEYISSIYLPKDSKLISISHRKDGWPGKIDLTYTRNGSASVKAIPQPRFWGYVAGFNAATPLGCLLCNDHLATDADIGVGDAWHPKFAGDLLGVSITLVRTKIGLRLIEEAIKAGALKCEDAALRDLFIAQGNHIVEANRYIPFRRKLIRKEFLDGLCEALSPDKTIVALQYTLNRLASRNRNVRRLLYFPSIRTLLSITEKMLYIKTRQIKMGLLH
jgi:coenzyme F420 hydrogenase subunit beta